MKSKIDRFFTRVSFVTNLECIMLYLCVCARACVCVFVRADWLTKYKVCVHLCVVLMHVSARNKDQKLVGRFLKLDIL